LSAEPSPQLLLIDCADRPGLIHGITGLLLQHHANIVANHEFVDEETGRFFMRTEFMGPPASAELARGLSEVLPANATIRLGRSGIARFVVLSTREPHCLGEILLRHASGELGASLQAVISNHASLAQLVERFTTPFHHVSHEGIDRSAHEQEILRILDGYRPDFLVLAKYMRVLSAGFVRRYPNRIINIHHSFLPAFTGAHPYRQAFARGVKIIGATAHFVTETLDEGPIIAQAVQPIDHSYRPAEMARAGRDVEKFVLWKALTLVFQERVFLSGNRTVVFE
jgi:formyltetrahydrofolate deformylase